MSNLDQFFEELESVDDLLDLISVEISPGSGHYILRAWVKDSSSSDIWLESVSYYLYDSDDLDEMKRLFIVHVLSHGYEFVPDEYWD